MNKFRKSVLLIIGLAMLLSGCVFGGGNRIGKEAALQIALTDAELTEDQVIDIEVELERDLRKTWYEVGFECGRAEYEYKIDAESGEILFSKTD